MYGENREPGLPEHLVTSFTIGHDDLETMVRKASAATDFKTLKIKLAGTDDVEIVKAIREVTDQQLYVDANQAWEDISTASQVAAELVELGVGLIEQPFPVGQAEKARKLRKTCTVPVVADEEVQSFDDVERLADWYDGINIKLLKAGGIREGFRMIQKANECGLKVLLGCMTESSIGISAAGQLAPLANWLDLDGNLLIENDTCTAIKTINGELKPTGAPGIGITDDSELRKLLFSND